MKSFLLPSLRALAVVRAAFYLMTLALMTATSLSPTGNAPAVPEDSRSLTAPGVVAEPVFRERGRRLRKEICLHDTKSFTLTHNTGDNVSVELDSESRIREIRSSGLMRGEAEARN